MSTHKTIIDQEFVLSFLKKDFSDSVTEFQIIEGGEGSQAYSFISGNEKYVIRINMHSALGFRKDKYAAAHFSSQEIPIPQVCKLGKIDDIYRYCISKHAGGKTISSFSKVNVQSIHADLFHVLDNIHSVDVSHADGYGKWDADGRGMSLSWKESLMSVGKYIKEDDHKPGLFEMTFLEKDVWDRTYAKLLELLPYCPEEKHLVHGDYAFGNILSDGRKITGVVDWEQSKYGDYIFDVSWLCFWKTSYDYADLYLKHAAAKNKQIKNFNERLRCYKYYIALSGISFYAYSQQADKYRDMKAKIDLI